MGRVSKFDAGMAVSLSVLAAGFDRSRDWTKDRLVKAGVRPAAFTSRGHAVWPFVPAVQALRDAERTAIEGALSEEEAAGLPPGERRQWFESERARVSVQKEKAELVSVDDFRRQYAEILDAAIDVIAGLPARLEGACNLEPNHLRVLKDALAAPMLDFRARRAHVE